MSKFNHNGKRYDTEKCKVIGEFDLFSHSNNYAGTRHLLVASDGQFIIHQTANGQDCYITSFDSVVSRGEAIETLNNIQLDDEQTKLAVECGLIEVVP